ncbi:hypothetical protein ACFVMC_17660 [Nocardia sp. NPDC127579]|uniref:hypothetical protein n=1 Tax=Nocardia sp. NPDC127579 TaxID=3345402 RepID=UPI00363F122E
MPVQLDASRARRSLGRLAALVAMATVTAIGPAAATPEHPVASIDDASVAFDLPRGAVARPGAAGPAVAALEALGVTPFLYPTATLCDDTGLALDDPALAGAVSGPWPVHTLTIPGLDLTAVETGQTLFAFVPAASDDAEDPTLRVAWLNISTGDGGLAALGPLTDVFAHMVSPGVPDLLRPLAEQAVRELFTATVPDTGVRAVPVDTGSGTVLAAVFGSSRTDTRTCFYLPTIGIVDVP